MKIKETQGRWNDWTTPRAQALETTRGLFSETCGWRNNSPPKEGRASLVAQVVKKSFFQCRTPEFDPWVKKISWRREQLATPVFWPGEFHGQSSLAGYSLWGSQRVRHDWVTYTSLHFTMETKWTSTVSPRPWWSVEIRKKRALADPWWAMPRFPPVNRRFWEGGGNASGK